jgi:uncharacterized protein YcfL
MKKYFLIMLMALGFVACSDPAKEAEVKALESKVADMQNVISKTKDSISALEEKERALKKELESLDMVK